MKANSSTLIIVTLFAIGITAMVSTVYADDDHQRIRQLQRSGEILSLEQIFDRARAVKRGRILDAELDDDDGRYIYEIELLDANGRVWEMEFDARTGRLLELEQDD
ncbi:PepSY domain-containing protein [Limnobacter parvus]|uniref:PepSY domain-containing protein n=1 Tax=Limnobacter parvus TaxID=2939690 RepID=A0ABT1XJ05_9BURK|nr:PepSY domain-containing protein [Limnobacter parvus]MCR2747268.1 PepSY domain-containing protein [Limnobacter parvus]